MQRAAAIVQETDLKRHHIRIAPPAQVQIHQRNYPLSDLSSGGFAILNPEFPIATGYRLSVTLQFTFNGFALQAEYQAIIRHYDAISHKLGCEFVELRPDHRALLTVFVKAFLDGDYVPAGDLLQAAYRGSIAHLPRQEVLNDAQKPWPLWRRLAYAMLIITLGGLGLALMGKNIYRHLYTITIADAYVATESIAVTATTSGVFKSALNPTRKTLRRNDLIGSIGATLIYSPCDCLIYKSFAQNGSSVAPATELVTLLPFNARPIIKTYLDQDRALKLKPGLSASIRIAGTDMEIPAKIGKVRYTRKHGFEQTLVLVQPSQILPVDLTGAPVRATFYLRGAP